MLDVEFFFDNETLSLCGLDEIRDELIGIMSCSFESIMVVLGLLLLVEVVKLAFSSRTIVSRRDTFLVIVGGGVFVDLVVVVAQVIMVARVVVRTISITLVEVEVDPPIRMG